MQGEWKGFIPPSSRKGEGEERQVTTRTFLRWKGCVTNVAASGKRKSALRTTSVSNDERRGVTFLGVTEETQGHFPKNGARRRSRRSSWGPGDHKGW